MTRPQSFREHGHECSEAGEPIKWGKNRVLAREKAETAIQRVRGLSFSNVFWGMAFN